MLYMHGRGLRSNLAPALAAGIRARLGSGPRLSTPPPVSVVLANRNDDERLHRVVDWLSVETDYPQLELILVDNGSTDGSLDFIRSAVTEFPVQVVENVHDRGLSEARNQGAAQASGELLLFLSNDIEPVEPGWLRELVACHLGAGAGATAATLITPASRGAGGVDGYRVYQRGLEFRVKGGSAVPAPRDEQNESLDEALGNDIECDAVAARCLLIDRSSHAEVGGFSGGYSYGCEDVDLCLKLREVGLRSICSGRSIVLCGAASAGNVEGNEETRPAQIADRRRLWRRWGPTLRSFDTRHPPRSLLQRPEARLDIGFEHLIALQMLENPEVFFVQVGALDGRTGDQIHPYVTRHGWGGIAVEPQPWYFERLQETYAGRDDIELHNVAVAEKRGDRSLYAIDPEVPGLPAWTGGIASFDRSHLERANVGGKDSAGLIRELTVECVTFADLLAGIERVDLLQIDVEGFDGEIVRLFPFNSYRPRIVRFESFSLEREDFESAIERLVSHDYKVAVAGVDTIAWLDADGESPR